MCAHMLACVTVDNSYKAWFVLSECLQMRFIFLQRYQFTTGKISANVFIYYPFF